MTTPNIEFKTLNLFFAVQFTANSSTSGWCEYVPKHRNGGGATSFQLSPGTYQVIMSWDGPEKVELNVRRNGTPKAITSVEAGGGPRESRIVTVVITEGESAALDVYRLVGPSRGGAARGALKIIRQPEPGEI